MTKSKQKSLNEFFKPYGSSSKSIQGNAAGSPSRKPLPLRNRDQNTPTKTVKSKTFIDLTVSSPIVPVSTLLPVSTTFPSSGLSGPTQDSGRFKSDISLLDRPLNTVKTFFPKQTKTPADMISASQSIQALKNDPEPSATSLKRKAAFISDEEDAPPVAGPSNSTAKSLPELLLSLKMTKDNKVAIPASVWKRVQKDDSISVRQHNKASPGGSREVDKTTTHLPDSGRTNKGVIQMTPISSFMVKDFKDSILLISGISASVAKKVRDNSDPNKAEKHKRIKEEAAKITDPILKKTKLMESSIFAGTQKVCLSNIRVCIQFFFLVWSLYLLI